MRVTFLLPPLNPHGGIRSNAELGAGLVRRGHRVVAVFQPQRRKTLRESVRSLVRGQGWPKYVRREASFFDELPMIEQRELDRHRPATSDDLPDADVVIGTWWETAEWLQGLPREKGVPVYMVRGHEITLTHFPDRCAATYRMPFHKVAISTWLVNIMRDTYGDDDVSLVPNSVDVSKFDCPPRQRGSGSVVSVMVSDSASKGTPTAIAVTERARAEIPDLRVLAFGFRKPSLALPGYFEFVENPPLSRIKEIYASSHAFLFTSPGEGFGRPPLEAMACRAPLVSTAVGGPMDFVRHGVNGFIAGVDDVDGLAKHLVEILKAPAERWQGVSQAAWDTAHGYSWDDAAARMELAFERALERRRLGEI
jgi:glycosyltransferase involved in cell wall biosynthesis